MLRGSTDRISPVVELNLGAGYDWWEGRICVVSWLSGRFGWSGCGVSWLNGSGNRLSGLNRIVNRYSGLNNNDRLSWLNNIDRLSWPNRTVNRHSWPNRSGYRLSWSNRIRRSWLNRIGHNGTGSYRREGGGQGRRKRRYKARTDLWKYCTTLSSIVVANRVRIGVESWRRIAFIVRTTNCLRMVGYPSWIENCRLLWPNE